MRPRAERRTAAGPGSECSPPLCSSFHREAAERSASDETTRPRDLRPPHRIYSLPPGNRDAGDKAITDF